MFDIGFYEMMLVGIVALIVVGPKDLPRMFRTVGQYVGKARGMARQFQSAMNDAARQTELQDVKKAMDGVKSATDPLNSAKKSARDYAKSFMDDVNAPPRDYRAEKIEAARLKDEARRDAVTAANAASSAGFEPHFDEADGNSMMPPRPSAPPTDVTPPAGASEGAANSPGQTPMPTPEKET